MKIPGSDVKFFYDSWSQFSLVGRRAFSLILVSAVLLELWSAQGVVDGRLVYPYHYNGQMPDLVRMVDDPRRVGLTSTGHSQPAEDVFDRPSKNRTTDGRYGDADDSDDDSDNMIVPPRYPSRGSVAGSGKGGSSSSKSSNSSSRNSNSTSKNSISSSNLSSNSTKHNEFVTHDFYPQKSPLPVPLRPSNPVPGHFVGGGPLFAPTTSGSVSGAEHHHYQTARPKTARPPVMPANVSHTHTAQTSQLHPNVVSLTGSVNHYDSDVTASRVAVWPSGAGGPFAPYFPPMSHVLQSTYASQPVASDPRLAAFGGSALGSQYPLAGGRQPQPPLAALPVGAAAALTPQFPPRAQLQITQPLANGFSSNPYARPLWAVQGRPANGQTASLQCFATGVLRTEAMHGWCALNCNHVPPYCPPSHCACMLYKKK